MAPRRSPRAIIATAPQADRVLVAKSARSLELARLIRVCESKSVGGARYTATDEAVEPPAGAPAASSDSRNPMPHLTADDGVMLYYEEAGDGTPIVFVHEFAGDYRSWEPQVRHFARRYRCITYSARGYLPSDVPEDSNRYSQERWREDLRCVLDALGI